jgi:hypothetical protein
MNHNQDPNKKKERQTNIISDADALAIAQTQAPSGRKGAGKKGKFNLSKAQNAGILKPKAKHAPQNSLTLEANFRSKSASAPLFYEEDGLRVPQYNDKGKKHTNARSGHTLGHKLSKKVLLGIVRHYAGDAKVKEFEKANTKCHELGMWNGDEGLGQWPEGQGHCIRTKAKCSRSNAYESAAKGEALAESARVEFN